MRPEVGVCGIDHRGETGTLDESARRLSHEELFVASRLVAEGHAVSSSPEGRGRGRSADLDVCGTPVEIKSWLPLDARGGRSPDPRSVLNKLLDARGQASTVVLNAAGSGLTASAALGGLALYGSRDDGGQLASVRVVGDGFDMAWTRRSELALTPPQGRSRWPDRSPQKGQNLGLGA
jgi:hypothetical protein